jgi:hypothetical protein
LSDDDCKRLNAASSWKAKDQKIIANEVIEYGISGISVDSENLETNNSICFGFKVPENITNEKIVRSNRFEKVIGCVWTSLYISGNYGLIVLMAATDDISDIFESDRAFQESIIMDLGKRSLSISLEVELSDEYRVLSPVLKALKNFCSGFEEFYYEEFQDSEWVEDHLRVIKYCKSVLSELS